MTVSDIVLRLVALRLGALLLAGFTLHALQAQRLVVIPATTISTTARNLSIVSPVTPSHDSIEVLLHDMLLHD